MFVPQSHNFSSSIFWTMEKSIFVLRRTQNISNVPFYGIKFPSGLEILIITNINNHRSTSVSHRS